MKKDMKPLNINGMQIELERKRIKNMYLKIIPPDGRLHVSAPIRMGEEEIRSFILSKQDWINGHLIKLQQRELPKPMDYVTGDEIEIWGAKYQLKVLDKENTRSKIMIMGDNIHLYVKNDSTHLQREKAIKQLYRKELENEIPSLISKWENMIGVKSSGWNIRDMKTRWGTCNIRSRKICLNLQLAKKAPKCLEYVVVHELVHLLEKSHNRVFKGHMDQFLPDWRNIKKELNWGKN